MNPVLVATAVTVVAGAIVAMSSREARIGLLGLAVALIGAPLLADPRPDPLPLAARIVAAVLAVELVWITVRSTTTRTRGSNVGWPVEALAAAAAFVVGYGAAGGLVGAAPDGATGSTALILGAGAALLVLAITPIVLARDILRLGIAATLLVTGATVVRAAVAGTPVPLEELVTAGVTVGLGVAVAAACANTFAARSDLAIGGARPVEPATGRVTGRQAHHRADGHRSGDDGP
jgi:hypothetical protein